MCDYESDLCFGAGFNIGRIEGGLMKKILWALVSVLVFPTFLWAATASWTDNANNEDGFIVQQCTGTCVQTGTWNELGRVISNVTSFVFTSIPGNSYRVLAYNTAGVSGPSNIVTLPTIPGAPTVFNVGP